MFERDQYQLVDFGGGRKLERFGSLLLDRPSPAAEREVREDAAAWQQAQARYERTGRDTGAWHTAGPLPGTWSVTCGPARFELKRTEFGHVGLFPEQVDNWNWIARQVGRARRELRLLNLFAYTGGSTLMAAAAGAQVVHVDAARNVVAWARRNATQSQLGQAPIRWIAEDAMKFVEREVRRGNHYDGVVLDPPSYGHGPKGEAWKLTDHLQPLLERCAELTAKNRALLLITCHTPGYGPAELQASVAEAVFGHCQGGVKAGKLWLKTAAGRRLASGAYARWPD